MYNHKCAGMNFKDIPVGFFNSISKGLEEKEKEGAVRLLCWHIYSASFIKDK